MLTTITKKTISAPVSALNHVGILQDVATEIPKFRKVYTPFVTNEGNDESLVKLYALLDEKVFASNVTRKDVKEIESIFIDDSHLAATYLQHLLDVENWGLLPEGKVLQVLIRQASYSTIQLINETIVVGTLVSDISTDSVVKLAYALAKTGRLETGTLQALIGSEINLGKKKEFFNSLFEKFVLSI